MDVKEIRERIELKKEQFALLCKTPKPHEVNMKVNTVNQYGFSILVYLTSSFVANRLNDSGLSYSLDYQERDNSVLAKLTYFDVVSEEFVSIKDVGVTSVNHGQKIQSIKSGFSDSTKRVYSRLAGNPFSGMPEIRIKGNVCEAKGKYYPAYGFEPPKLNITKMEFIGNQCSSLIITDANGNIIFNFENNVLISNYVPDEEHNFTMDEPQGEKELIDIKKYAKEITSIYKGSLGENKKPTSKTEAILKLIEQAKKGKTDSQGKPIVNIEFLPQNDLIELLKAVQNVKA